MKAYIVKIELKESKPLIWRRVRVPAGATFKRFHDIIQNVTNFQSGYPNEAYHLYEFDITAGNLLVTNDEEAYLEHQHFIKNRTIYDERIKEMPPELSAFEIIYQKNLQTEVRKPNRLEVDHYLEQYKKMTYTYDFGDGWAFRIKLEKIDETNTLDYPVLLAGSNTAPPEDVGGMPGFYDFMSVYADPEHPDHETVAEWAESFGFERYDPDRINQRLKRIKIRRKNCSDREM